MDTRSSCAHRKLHDLRRRRPLRRFSNMDSPERAKETKTAEQLVAMIREDMSKVDGCPDRGIVVTVYGIPWRAMLSFGVGAGPVRNKAALQRFFDIITERMQRLYNLRD